MTGEVIKSFLLGLGFDVDDSSLAKFNKSIISATVKVAALYTGIQVATAGIFKGIAGISEDFEQLGYSMRLVAPAVNKALILRQALLDAYSKAGVNLTKVVQQSILFNLSLTKTKYAFDAIFKSVAARFFPLLTKQMDIFRLKIFQNLPKIQATLEKFIKFLFKAFEATVQLGTTVWSILGRIWDFFAKLDEATNGWSTKILAAVAAWELLNLEFLATPLGMLLTGLLAILALFDDFKVWQEGGKSLFDWSAFIPIIDAVGDAFKFAKESLGAFFLIIFDVIGAINQLLHLNFAGFKESMKNLFGDIGEYVSKLVDSFIALLGIGKAVAGWLPAAGGWLSKAFSGNAQQNINNTTQPQPALPVGGGNNQKVNQETNINVQGSADANATGKAVADQQGKVNFDMTRNLKGATR